MWLKFLSLLKSKGAALWSIAATILIGLLGIFLSIIRGEKRKHGKDQADTKGQVAVKKKDEEMSDEEATADFSDDFT